MLEFRKIDISDRDKIKKILRESDYRGCEYSFANNFAWHRLYKTYISFYEDFYISVSEMDGLSFTFPAGKGDYKKLFSELEKYSNERGYPLCVSSVTDENLPLIKEIFSGRSFSVSENDGWYDYIYNAADLRELLGKKYAKKRNHLKKIKGYDYSYSPLKETDFDDCITFAAEHYNSKGAFGESEAGEQYAIDMFFKYFNELSLSGGIIRVDGKTAAFTVGEVLNSDTADIHIEKADAQINGSYAAINNFYAKTLPQDIVYINREEDMGISGLRKSKQSYYPAFLLRKYTVTLN